MVPAFHRGGRATGKTAGRPGESPFGRPAILPHEQVRFFSANFFSHFRTENRFTLFLEMLFRTGGASRMQLDFPAADAKTGEALQPAGFKFS
jgi:hypothetical protein